MLKDRLRCPADNSHSRFVSAQRIACEHLTTIDADGNILDTKFDSKIVDLSTYRDHAVHCGVCGTEVRRARTPITFTPTEGMVINADFSIGFKVPEMVKPRPVIVISPRDRNRGTSIIVPLSSVKPDDPKSPYVSLEVANYPFLYTDSFAKCEMVMAIGRHRMYLLDDRTTHQGIDSRQTMIGAKDLALIRAGITKALG